MYASQLVRAGRFDEAERHLRKAGDADGATQESWDTHADDMLIAFIALYDAWGKAELAADYRRRRAEALR